MVNCTELTQEEQCLSVLASRQIIQQEMAGNILFHQHLNMFQLEILPFGASILRITFSTLLVGFFHLLFFLNFGLSYLALYINQQAFNKNI